MWRVSFFLSRHEAAVAANLKGGRASFRAECRPASCAKMAGSDMQFQCKTLLCFIQSRFAEVHLEIFGEKSSAFGMKCGADARKTSSSFLAALLQERITVYLDESCRLPPRREGRRGKDIHMGILPSSDFTTISSHRINSPNRSFTHATDHWEMLKIF